LLGFLQRRTERIGKFLGRLVPSIRLPRETALADGGDRRWYRRIQLSHGRRIACQDARPQAPQPAALKR
jgi:hypothetical protein